MHKGKLRHFTEFLLGLHMEFLAKTFREGRISPIFSSGVLCQGLGLYLCDALGDPHEVADFLLPEAHVCKEDAVVELLLVGEDQPPHLLLIQHLVQHLALTIPHLAGPKHTHMLIEPWRNLATAEISLKKTLRTPVCCLHDMIIDFR